ncbi:MAG: hypothetical protein C4324_00925 [Blastocatellia bacterium]
MRDIADLLHNRLATQAEWLIALEDGGTFAFGSDEAEIITAGSRLFIELPTDAGLRRWRITAAKEDEGAIMLDVERRLGQKREKIRLLPRTLARELELHIELGRIRRANEIARLVCRGLKGSKIESVSLNERNGRMANILVSATGVYLIAVADVTDSLRPESILSATLVLFARTSVRKNRRVSRALIISEKRIAGRLSNLCALLNAETRAKLEILELDETQNPPTLTSLPQKSINSVLRRRGPALKIPKRFVPSEAARLIMSEYPDAIDSIQSSNGETLRFRGLAFARIRILAGSTMIWFGIARPRTLLDESNRSRFQSLLSELAAFRHPAAENKRHRLYLAAPEAWLESILRRNIGLIDSNLILSPIYHQFRTASGKIDLLALRRDGRLVIIELKTSPDRETVFQTADYWRRIESQRRSGELSRHRLFGEREIADRPALIYAVAPALDFHKDFDRFARMLAPEIELWRFELHREWRFAVKVIERVMGSSQPEQSLYSAGRSNR